jgi:hypothetical protein
VNARPETSQGGHPLKKERPLIGDPTLAGFQ